MRIILLTLLLAVFYPGPVCQANATQQNSQLSSGALNISAQVRSECQISNIQNMNFRYNGSTTTARASFDIACVKQKSPINVELSEGNHFSVSRRLQGPSSQENLVYELYQDSTMTEPWGTVAGGTAKSINPPASLQIYGRILGNQDVVAGLYSDVVTIFVIF